MADASDGDARTTLLRYALLGAVVTAYGGVFLGGLVATFYGVAWLDETLLQPAVGGSHALSLLLFAAVQLSYLWLSYRLTNLSMKRGSDERNADSVNWGKQ
jgi:hypothetical protein